MSTGNLEIPGNYEWLFVHRRLVVAIASGVAGIFTLTLGWFQVSDTAVIAEQLSWIAGAGLLGIFLLGIAAIAYWAEQRERELARLSMIEMYLAAVAEAMGLTENAPPTANGSSAHNAVSTSVTRPARQVTPEEA